MIFICPADLSTIDLKNEPEVSLADDRVSNILEIDGECRRKRIIETDDGNMRGRQELLLRDQAIPPCTDNQSRAQDYCRCQTDSP